MNYRPLSEEYLETLHKITDYFVELCNRSKEGGTVRIKDPRSSRDLSHYGTLRDIITPFMHYSQRGLVEAMKI